MCTLVMSKPQMLMRSVCRHNIWQLDVNLLIVLTSVTELICFEFYLCFWHLSWDNGISFGTPPVRQREAPQSLGRGCLRHETSSMSADTTPQARRSCKWLSCFLQPPVCPDGFFLLCFICVFVPFMSPGGLDRWTRPGITHEHATDMMRFKLVY